MCRLLPFLLLISLPLSKAGQQKSEAELRSELAQAHTKAQIQNALNDVEALYRREQRWTQQADALKTLVNFWATNMKPDSVGFARYSIELARALERCGENAAAEPYLRSGIAIYEKSGAIYAVAEQSAKFSLAVTLRREGKGVEADQIKASLPPGRPRSPKPDSLPTVLAKTEPQYTKDALRNKVSGWVELSVTVDEKGRAQNVEVLKPLGFGLDQNAIAAVKKWRFQPALLNGSPVSMPAEVQVSFRLL